MSTFQILLIASLIATGVTLVALVLRGVMGRLEAAVSLLAVIAGIVFAIAPNLTTVIARAIGINRGTDLLLYLLVLAVMYGFLAIYLKLRRVRRELTLLVRELAIREATDRARPREADARSAEPSDERVPPHGSAP